MSASSKKKLRKEQNAAHMSERQKAAQKEAKQLKIYTWTFWTIMILIVAIVGGMALSGPVNVLIDRMGTAVEIDGEKISTTQLNYYYIDAINQYVSNNSYYISYLLDVDTPLNEQVADSTTGQTWADSFLRTALSNVKNTYALYNAAKAAGYELTAEEETEIDELFDSMNDYAKSKGYRGVSHYLKSIYGNSASKSSYREYYEVNTLASSYYNDHADELKDSYTEPQLREYEKDEPYNYNAYSFISYYMSVDDFKLGGTKDSDGDVTYSDEEVKAAEEALKEAAEALAIADNTDLEKLAAAIEALEALWEQKREDAAPESDTSEDEDDTTDTTDPSESTGSTEGSEPTEPSEPAESSEPTTDATDATDGTDPTDGTDGTEPSEPSEGEEDEEEEEEDKPYTENEDLMYSKISSAMQEWLRDEERKAGDIAALPYTTTSTDSDGEETETLKGYYVVIYQSVNDNTYALADVRHILVAFEGGTYNSTTGSTTYSDAEKAAAKKEAEKLLQMWKDGEATEDSFAALANEHSDDGDGTTGGLYEAVYPGQMVTNFNDWCFDDARQSGDTGIVESTYGYHVMYYVGDNEQNYRDYMITNDMLSEDMEEWNDALVEKVTLTEKNTTRVDLDVILSVRGLA